ncbi:hypothetical protein D3C87_1935760 [compost metagenome]
MSNRQKLSAAFDLRCVETPGKDLAHCGNEGSAAGEEHLVDFGRCGIRLGQHMVQCAFDLCQIVCDPGLEIRTLDHLLAGLAERCEIELGFFRGRKRHLGG